MSTRPSALPDPLNDSPRLQLDNVEDFLSRLADQEIDRMIGPNGTQYDIVPIAPESLDAQPPVAARATPVQELNAQLDTFFDQMRTRGSVPPPPARVLEEEPISPATQHQPMQSPRAALMAPIEEPLPAYLRPIAWLNAPVIAMPRAGRVAASIVSLLTFAGSIWALAYVLTLRQG